MPTGPDFVITVRHGRHGSLGPLREELESEPRQLAKGPATVLHAIADHVVEAVEQHGRLVLLCSHRSQSVKQSSYIDLLATGAAQGYAMQYRTCNNDLYEVRWNVTEVSPNPSSRISLLTVSSRQVSAANGRATLFAPPTTLRTLIEN